jgi:hypothetical protein
MVFNGDNVEVTGQTFQAMSLDTDNNILDSFKFNIDVVEDVMKLSQFLVKWKNTEVKIIMV